MSSRSPPGSVSGTSSYATRKSTITTSQRVYRTQVLKSVGIFIEEAIDEARRQLLYPPEMTGISDEIVDEISNDLVRSSSSLLADSGDPTAPPALTSDLLLPHQSSPTPTLSTTSFHLHPLPIHTEPSVRSDQAAVNKTPAGRVLKPSPLYTYLAGLAALTNAA
ncbi:uncharacterized protein BKA78DRAFT_357029 [Phyllosticta capitalensis]|uniref:uncharacterized protein n=1 Tax=Phyllosticta capitalensis TaxID=121624 RepID=UPI00312F1BD8